MGIIKDELIEIKEKYSNDRRTMIKSAIDDIDDEDLIEEEEVIITLTNQGYIKRIPANTYKVQNRGGKGVVGMATKDDDFVQDLFVTSTHDNILFFTNKGRVYMKKAYEIKDATRQSKGQAIINLLPLQVDEKVTQVLPININDKEQFIVFATKEGKIKKTSIDEFTNIRSSGIIALSLNEDDELIAARVVEEGNEAVVVTAEGQSIIFMIEDVRSMGRNASGVKAITLNKDDFVVDLSIKDDNEYLFTVTENGFGKKTLLKHYNIQKRGGKGVKTYKITKKTGKIVATKLVNLDDEIILVSAKGDIIRLLVKDISTLGRHTQGVILKKVKNDDEKIVACAKYIADME